MLLGDEMQHLREADVLMLVGAEMQHLLCAQVQQQIWFWCLLEVDVLLPLLVAHEMKDLLEGVGKKLVLADVQHLVAVAVVAESLVAYLKEIEEFCGTAAW